MKRSQSSEPTPPGSPFREIETEMFPKGLPCRVISAIRVLDTGRVKANGNSWLAELYDLNCSTTLLPDQPALAIGRKGNTLIVMPLHCLLWPQYLEEYSQWLKHSDVELIERHERGWRI